MYKLTRWYKLAKTRKDSPHARAHTSATFRCLRGGADRGLPLFQEQKHDEQAQGARAERPEPEFVGHTRPHIYGAETLADVEQRCRTAGEALGLEIDFRQSNAEHQLIDWLHAARHDTHGIVINPAAYTHTSVALADALSAIAKPVIEVHISNVHRREAFRHHSYVSALAEAVICGCGTEGYVFALQRLATLFAQEPHDEPSVVSDRPDRLGIGGSLSPAMHEEEGFRQGSAMSTGASISTCWA